MTTAHYVALLHIHLYPFIDILYSNNNGLFQQIMQQVTRCQISLSSILEIFGKCCDQNIQLIWINSSIYWTFVERSVYIQDPALINIKELWTTIETAWFNIFPEIFRALGETMPHKIIALFQTRKVLHNGRYLSHYFWLKKKNIFDTLQYIILYQFWKYHI